MAFNPSSKIWLSQAPIDNSYINQLTFSNETERRTYFCNTIKQYEFDDYLIVRRSTPSNSNTIIRVQRPYEDVRTCNYVVYTNGTKYYYGFIVDYFFINELTTEIEIETDVYQTWRVALVNKNCTIEREHVTNDTIGHHTYPENLEIGEYRATGKENVNLMDELVIIVGTTVQFDYPDFTEVYNSTYENVFGAMIFYAVKLSAADVLGLTLILLDAAGKGDAVKIIFMFPKCFINSSFSTDLNPIAFNSIKGTYFAHTYNQSHDFQNIQGTSNYVPKNNKLYVYPYRQLYVTNNQGGFAELKYEKFLNNNYQFALNSVLSPSPIVKLTPNYYNGEVLNQDEAININNYPVCSWKYGVWENWYAQNAASIGLSNAAAGIQIAGGLGTILFSSGAAAAIGGAQAVSGLQTIAGHLAQIHDMKAQPPQAKGNINSSNYNIANNIQHFTMINKSITAEMARIIDDYFSMYGYKRMIIGTPQENTRKYWNYIKTIDFRAVGNVPSKDKAKFCNIFNNGITLWHRSAGETDFNVGNYNRSNVIL